MDKKFIPDRFQVPLEETWKLESIFESVEAWENAIVLVKSQIPDLASFKGKLSEGPEVLVSFLKKWESSLRLVGKIFEYGSLPSAVDTTDQNAIARAGLARAIYIQLNATVAFLDPELISIGFDKLKEWCKQEKYLEVFGFYFEKLERSKSHVRSAEVEELLTMVSEPLEQFIETHSALTNADLKFSNAISSDGSEIEVGQSNIEALITNQDRIIRENSWKNYADGYLSMKNTLSGVQTGVFQKDVFNARAHGFSTSLKASLFPNNIPDDVFHNLINVFRENLPVWHKYWQVRKEFLGIEEFNVWDIKAPLSTTSPRINYDEAVNWICEGMAPLGEMYVQTLRNGCLKERWVDRAVNKGKGNGAFSSGVYDTQPFIMMSFNEDVFSLSTLAHELGHSMHTLYSNKNQPFVNSNYALFVAEVASNFNQAMVRDYLFKTRNDPIFQLSLIEETMSNFHRYFFIMPILAQWELAMHERIEHGKALNSNIMIKTCADLFAEGYGNVVTFNEEQVGITWAQFPHMYMDYYVYQYATGISGAHALVDQVLSKKPQAVENYLAFLSAGGSMYPLDALKLAGVDLTSPEPVEKAFSFLSNVVDRLGKLVD